MRWYLNLRVQTKLIIAFTITAVLTVAVGVGGLVALDKARNATTSMYNNELRGVSAAGQLRSAVLDVGRLYRQMLLDGAGRSAEENAAKVEAQLAQIDEALGVLKKVEVTGEAEAAMKRITETDPDWRARVRETVDRAKSGELAAAREAASGNSANAGQLVKDLALLTSTFEHDAETEVNRVAADNLRSRFLMIFGLAFAVVLGLVLGVAIARIISRPLAQAAWVLGRVAEGDFTEQLSVSGRDETGRMAEALNTAVHGIRDSLRNVFAASQSVSNAARELTASSASISSGAQEQASSLEETAASLEEITSTVQQNADNSQQAAQVAHGAREVAEKGGQIVGEAVRAMAEINASSRKISDIITTIDEIAFQTNLLALNAAVEAARAGEQGRGFAVVAGEVRNLAQRSASAAKEIKGLIGESVEKVEAGSRLVNQSGETLAEIVNAVKRVTDIVGEIAAASREQSAGISQVGTAVTQMDQVTQANAAQTEELAGTAESLSAQAEQLQKLVAAYRLGSDDRAATESPAPLRIIQGRAPISRVAAPAARAKVAGTRQDDFEEF